MPMGRSSEKRDLPSSPCHLFRMATRSSSARVAGARFTILKDLVVAPRRTTGSSEGRWVHHDVIMGSAPRGRPDPHPLGGRAQFRLPRCGLHRCRACAPPAPTALTSCSPPPRSPTSTCSPGPPKRWRRVQAMWMDWRPLVRVTRRHGECEKACQNGNLESTSSALLDRLLLASSRPAACSSPVHPPARACLRQADLRK